MTDEVVDIVIFQINGEVAHGVGIDIHDVHADLTASEFLAHLGRQLEGVDLAVGIDAALKAEAGISLQAVATGALADPSRIEVSALQKYILRCLIRTATLSPIDTTDTHGLLCIADHQVVVAKLAVYAVERLEDSAVGHGLHDDFLACDHVCIKAMQRLAECHHYIVGDVHDVINRTKTNCGQVVLQPLWTLFHLTAGNSHGCVAGASLGVLHANGNLEIVVIHLEVLDTGAMQGGLVAILHEPRIEVASHAIV